MVCPTIGFGTNAIGTAITQQGPSAVAGGRAFRRCPDSNGVRCHPVTARAGHMTGVIDLTCAAENFRLMLLSRG
jgi:transcriptional regulator of acetoin/glycerol metabolism